MTDIAGLTERPESNVVKIDLQTKNTIPVKVIPGLNDPWTMQRREAFDKLWADYLAVTSKLSRGSEGRGDGYIDRLVEKQAELIWKIIRAHGPDERQLNCKFSLLRDLMVGEWMDGRQLALLEAIRNECLNVREAT